MINLFIKVWIFVICSYFISVKDKICHIGGVLNIPINQYLIQSVKNSHGRYLADLEAKWVLQEKERKKQKTIMWLKMKLEWKMLMKKSSEKLINFQFDHCQCFHKTPNENFPTIKVITNEKMMTHLCFMNPITTQMLFPHHYFNYFFLVLNFMLLSAQENVDLE